MAETPCGLTNLGNTSHINVVVQALRACTPLTRFFLTHDVAAEVNTENPLGSRGEVAIAFADLLKAMAAGGVVTPDDFRVVLAKYAPQFSGYQASDCMEVMACVLDFLHEDLNRVVDKPLTEPADCTGRPDAEALADARHLSALRNDSIVWDVFTLMMKSATTCSTCGLERCTFQPAFTLQVTTQGATSLEDAIAKATQDEEMSDLYCERCKAFGTAVRRQSVHHFPPVLVVDMRRVVFDFETFQPTKDCTFVDFPTKGWRFGDAVYDLVAVLNHLGTAIAGHDTAFVKCGANWRRCDDIWTPELSGDVVTKDARALVYVMRQRVHRMQLLHVMGTAWRTHGGVPAAPVAADTPRLAALASTLSLRRFCRVRGGDTRPHEVLEPFAHSVAMFL